MSLRPILHYPDQRLRLKAAPVTNFDQNLQTLIDDMFETMYEGNGIGLAANQINVQQRIIVVDISDDSTQPQCFINPEIKYREGSEISKKDVSPYPIFMNQLNVQNESNYMLMTVTANPYN